MKEVLFFFLGLTVLQALLRPLVLGLKLLVHCGSGLLCLWLVNAAAVLSIPINAVTVAVSGILGLPGMGILAMLAVL